MTDDRDWNVNFRFLNVSPGSPYLDEQLRYIPGRHSKQGDSLPNLSRLNKHSNPRPSPSSWTNSRNYP